MAAGWRVAAEVLASVKWLALSSALPPKTGQFEIRTVSPTVASRLKQLLDELVASRKNGDQDPLELQVEAASTLVRVNSIDQAAESVRTLEAMLMTRESQIANSMKQIAVALHNYYADMGHFPPQSLVDSEGNRLLSWRVLILPYLDQQELFDRFHLNEPWDSPHNLPLARNIPFPYRATSNADAGNGPQKTRVLAPLTANSFFGRPGRPASLGEITDGPDQTVWFVQAAPQYAVVWSQPADLEIELDNPAMLWQDENGCYASMVDGAVRYLSNQTTSQTVQALLSIDGGDIVSKDDL